MKQFQTKNKPPMYSVTARAETNLIFYLLILTEKTEEPKTYKKVPHQKKH